MLTLYWSCFLIGGVFVLLAVVGGIDGVEFELDELGMDSDVAIFDQKSRSLSTFDSISKKSRKFPFLRLIKNLKFWTFGSCFFGLTGILLSSLQTGLPTLAITLIAIAMGLICGTAMSGLLLYLRHQQTDSLISHDDLVGLAGTVEIPFDAQSRGKVRLKVKGSILEVVAFTDGNSSFQLGEQVVVVGTQNDRIWVVSSDSFNLPPDALGSGTP
ncbi:NfeD-like protein [Acaryochloris sp. 'Moss Beach']|uniref:NfeD-like protein n=1 Tax=Acaryochloris TaxID=155977 RepID=UPI001F3814DE|nr:NfeD-like protein [Acaryochloris sp. 'Moss Beach']UJB70163.1 NfeD-like protein [Acaryochloris sp. 'Moss Beach']